jgi:hypothetical protein
MVPPLKSYPEVVESDHSIDSDDPRVEHFKADLLARIMECNNDIGKKTNDKNSEKAA